MTIRTPTLPEAAIAVALTVGASAIAVTWLAVSGHRFVQINAMRGQVLDSRTGCVWIMTLRPPAKVCPGERLMPVPANQTRAEASPAPLRVSLVHPAPDRPSPISSARAGVEALTPDSFMAEQVAAETKLRAPASFVPDEAPREHGIATVDDIVTPESLPSREQFEVSHLAPPQRVQPEEQTLNPLRLAEELTRMILSGIVGAAALWFAIRPRRKVH